MTLKAQITDQQVAETEKNNPDSVFTRVWDFHRDVTDVCLATFWRQATPGTTYWRCHLPALYLPGQVVNFGEGMIEFDEETDRLLLSDQRGVAVWQFLGDDGRSRFALKQKSQGVPTVMEMDDNYLIRPVGSGRGIWAKTHEEAMLRAMQGIGGGYSVEAHKNALPQWDALIVSTEYLADTYDRWNPNIFVCENSVDPTDWHMVKRDDREVPRFGYYGSAGHASDFATMKKAFKRHARTRDWMFLGFSPPGWTGLKAPWANNMMEARENLGLIDIGVCPIKPSPFSNCKSDVKAMEYAMAGVMPIVSKTEPYRWWWDAMRWPWVASNEAEWSAVLHDAANLSLEDVRAEAAKAKALVIEHRTIQENIDKWLEVIDFVS